MSEVDTNICTLAILVLFNHQMCCNELKLHFILGSYFE
jgi:hypothetical protein